jgi:hypothetical protein
MPWELTGNSGTTAANFVGTTDNRPLVIKTKNVEAMQVDPNGNVGIGTTTPGAPLQIGWSGATKDGKIILGAGNGAQYRLWSMGVPYGNTTVTSPNYGFVIRDETGGADRFVIDWDSGNVGIPGSLNVGGDITMPASDFAEDFPVEASDAVEPGTVMTLDDNGVLRPSVKSYDRKVVGVISGAGDYRPGLILDRDKSVLGRLPLALVGKVYCKVDATFSAIVTGDLLTSSPTTGHAMKAGDPMLAFGAVIGKALQPLRSGHGLIPILVALQ